MATPYNISTTRPLKGLRSSVSRHALEDGEFGTLENFNTNRGGYLEKRRGIWRANNDHPGTAGEKLTLMAIVRYINAGAHLPYAFAYDNNDLFKTTGGTVISPTWAVVPGVTGQFEWGFEWGWVGAPYHLQMCRRNGQTIAVVASTNAVNAGGGPAGTFCLPYRNRMWVLNTADPVVGQENRLYWSMAGAFNVWVAPNGGFVDIQPGDGQMLVSAIVYNDTLWIFKNRSIWTMSVEDDPNDAQLRLIHASIGCVSRGSPQLVEGFLYFHSEEGVYRTDGTTFEEVSEPIRDKFVTADVTDRENMIQGEAVYWDNKYILNPGKALTPTNPTIYVFDVVSETWTTWRALLGNTSIRGMKPYTEANKDYLCMGSGYNNAGASSGLYYLTNAEDAWYRDDTAGSTGGADVNSYSSTAKLGVSDQDQPGYYKRNHYNALDVEGSAAENIQCVDFDRTPVASNTVRLPDTKRRFVAFPGAGKYRAKGIDITATTQTGETPGPLKIYSAISADAVREPAHRLSGNAS